jgi:hypothetical protein
VLQRGRQHRIVVEYAEAWGAAELALAWSSASQPLEVVPSSQLVPAPTPPAQPSSGTGGRAYPHAGCTLTQRPVWWNDDLTYWVLERRARRRSARRWWCSRTAGWAMRRRSMRSGSIICAGAAMS